MTVSLKDYQKRCLAELAAYLRAVAESDAKSAFDAKPRPSGTYEMVPGWKDNPKCPYVCVRVPTGGGKTLLAAHAVGSICENLLRADRCLALWLAPSDAIVSQTYKLLRSRASSARQALNAAFGGQLEVLSIDDALSVTPATLSGACTIIVSSGQAWKRSSEDVLRVFKNDNAAMMAHLQNVPPSEAARLEKFKWGGLVPSLANVLRLHRPVVIIDEGHKFRTDLTFETLCKFDPRAVVEFTATPYETKKGRVRCNVLVEASAADLKMEHMIKAPIELRNSKKWQDAVRLAIAKRAELGRIAQEEERKSGEYVRPIVLFKAQDESQERANITANALREHLIKSESILPAEIAVYTGKEKDLPDNIQSPSCPVNFVITVDALSEGWDCPFAYVLCVIANLSSGTAVEQILGRVLRLPSVRPKDAEALNQAYCFTSSEDFRVATDQLREAIVKGGFGRDEAEDMIKRAPTESEVAPTGGLWMSEPVELVVARTFTPEQRKALEKVLPGQVSFEPASGGTATRLVYSGEMIDERTIPALEAALNTGREPNAAKRLVKAVAQGDGSHAAIGTLFQVSGLAIKDANTEHGVSLFDGQHRESSWSLSGITPIRELDGFNPNPDGVDLTTLDVESDGTWSDHYRGRLAATASWSDQSGPRSLDQLASWLDRHVIDHRVTQNDKRPFIERALAYLLKRKQASIESLAPIRWKLAELLSEAIDNHRIRSEREQFQILLDGSAEVPTQPPPSIIFSFERVRSEYPFMRALKQRTKFGLHYYKQVGEMNDAELACAQQIDTHPNVETWIRNLDRAPGAFFLPTPEQRFYPDFVVKLRDGRYAAVEYKGPMLEDSESERMKHVVGKLWAGRSAGKYVFVWVTGAPTSEILRELNAQ